MNSPFKIRLLQWFYGKCTLHILRRSEFGTCLSQPRLSFQKKLYEKTKINQKDARIGESLKIWKFKIYFSFNIIDGDNKIKIWQLFSHNKQNVERQTILYMMQQKFWFKQSLIWPCGANPRVCTSTTSTKISGWT